MTMRILLSADPGLTVPPEHYGGIERIAAALLTAYRRLGHQTCLVATAESTAEVDTFIPWPESDPAGPAAHFRNARCLARAAKIFRPDVIHSFSRLAYLLPVLPKRGLKVMSYQRVVGARQVSLANLISRKTLKFTGCSEYICGLGRQGGGDWHAIHNFVELEKFPYRPAVAPDAPLVFLSRVERIKGADVAIMIARQAGRRLVIAGNHADSGDEGDYWKTNIAPEIGHNGVEYVGPVNDAQKAELLGQAAAMLVPIQWDEPFGIVFAEALACGTPVISSPRGALPEIVESGRNGFLVNSVAEGVEAVAALSDIDRSYCRRTAEVAFSADVIVAKYLALYAAGPR